MEQKITLSDYNIIPVGAQFIAPTRGVQGALPPAGVWDVPHKRGRKGVQGAKSPAGVWGVPSFSFSSPAAAGGKESLKSAPMERSPLPEARGCPPKITLFYTLDWKDKLP